MGRLERHFGDGVQPCIPSCAFRAVQTGFPIIPKDNRSVGGKSLGQIHPELHPISESHAGGCRHSRWENITEPVAVVAVGPILQSVILSTFWGAGINTKNLGEMARVGFG